MDEATSLIPLCINYNHVQWTFDNQKASKYLFSSFLNGIFISL